jgi:Arc/MetJ-type ribon-helix-helix transcriptional regulator
MKTVSTKIDDFTKYQLEEIMEKEGYKSKSDFLRVVLADFLQKKQLKWKKRGEMREFFKNRSKIKSGEIIEGVREEEDQDI